MLSVLAASLLAASVPSDKLTSVTLAAYWYKKDERGRGDEISELAKPKRFPAFAISEDEFVIADPLVREKHLDRIEILFRGDKVPAKEVGRFVNPDAVLLKADHPVKGVRPLAFQKGDPVEKLVWKWNGDTLTVSSAGVGTNDSVVVVASTGRVFRKGVSNTLYLDKDRNPVWVDFGSRFEIPDGKFDYVPPTEWPRLPADDYEKSAKRMEDRLASATLGVVIHLEPVDKENGSRRYSRYDDDSGNEIDALGYAIEGRVLVPSDLNGEKISRLGKVEATFPDGSTTNLVFTGAIAEWNAIVFDIPEGFKDKVSALSVAKGSADDFDNGIAWIMIAENENGRVVTTATRRRFSGVKFLRGAGFVPFVGDWRSGSRDDDDDMLSRRFNGFVLDGDGNIAAFALCRRFSSNRWSRSDTEALTTADLSRFIAGECFNPEFMPRKEEERNRFVWLGTEAVRLTDALAREKKAQSFTKEYSRPPYVTEVYPDSPAAKAGLKVGDILLAVRRGTERERSLEADYDYSYSTPWPEVENSLNTLMTEFGVGAKVTIVYARDGKRCETPVVLESAPVHYKNAPKARNRSLGLSVRDMTFEVRRFFKFDDKASGIVIAKVKPGSPADVAGLDDCELVTEVNGEKVMSAKDFAAKVKGKKDLVFAVRHLAQTRIVKIHVEPDADAEKDKEKGK